MIYPYIACLWSSKRMWWFRWNMSPQFGKRNVSKKHQLFSKEIELSGWYILPLKTDPSAYYWRSFFSFLTILILNVGFGWWSLFLIFFDIFDNFHHQYGFCKVINIFLCFQYFRQFQSTIWVLDGNQYDQRRFQLWSAPQCIFCNFLSLHRPLCFVESKNGLICVLFPICVSCCPLHVHWPLNIDERCEYLQTWELHQRRTARPNDHRPFGIRAGSVDHCGNTEYRFKLFLPFGIHVCRVDHCDSTEYR